MLFLFGDNDDAMLCTSGMDHLISYFITGNFYCITFHLI